MLKLKIRYVENELDVFEFLDEAAKQCKRIQTCLLVCMAASTSI